MDTPVTVLEAMAHVSLQSSDKETFLIFPGSSVSQVVAERPVYYSMT